MRQWPREQYEVKSSEPTPQRRAEPGELCPCGRPAAVVYLSEKWGDTGDCLVPDGGQEGPCVFCGQEDAHPYSRCPAYRLRLDREVER